MKFVWIIWRLGFGSRATVTTSWEQVDSASWHSKRIVYYGSFKAA